METVEPQILRRRRLGCPADERRKVLDAPDVVLLRLLPEMTRGHIVDHALTKRADTTYATPIVNETDASFSIGAFGLR